MARNLGFFNISNVYSLFVSELIMRVYNHTVIESMKLVGTKDPLKIEYEGELIALFYILNKIFRFLVAKLCQKLGLNPTKMDVGSAVSRVMAFFKKSRVKKINSAFLPMVLNFCIIFRVLVIRLAAVFLLLRCPDLNLLNRSQTSMKNWKSSLPVVKMSRVS